jgi:proteasome lid subunit RPN8/RPN11
MRPRRKPHGKGRRKPRRRGHLDHFRDVFIENRTFRTLITSAIEVYNRETNGAIMGRRAIREIEGRRTEILSVKDVYPFQTDRRTPSEVVHGNKSAFRRVLRAIESMNTEIIGGYHSHPLPYEQVGLSEEDVDAIKEDIEVMNKIGQERVKKGWIEVLLSIKKKHYKRSSETEWYISDYVKKVRVTVRTKKKVAYDILVSAYWIYPKEKYNDKPISKMRFGVKEVAVYVPWTF